MVALIHEWNTRPEYTGPYGIPIELPFTATEDRPGFSDLVARLFEDEKPETVLQELMRTNAVTETESGWFRVLTRDYILTKDSPESIASFLTSLENYVGILDFNMTEKNPRNRFFEREVYTEQGIRPENLPRFKTFFHSRAQQLLEEIDNWLALLEPPDDNSKENTVRTGLAIFHYVKKDE